MFRLLCLLTSCYLLLPTTLQADSPPGDGEIYIFLDCDFCNQNQIKQELNYLNFAVDPYRSNIQVLINRQTMASGGRQYNLEVIGRSEWEGEKVSFTFTSLPTMTTFEENEQILKKIELGLAPFIAKTPLAEKVTLSIERPKEGEVINVVPYESFWQNWIYELGSSAWWSSESIRSNVNFRVDMDIDNVTPKWRVRIRPFYNYRQQNVQTSDGEAIVIRRRAYFSGSVVRSISDHWSVGMFNSYFHSNYNNIDLDAWIAPAIEYSFFSYDKVPMKEFTVAYRIGYLSRNYIEETVFELLAEQRYRQMLDIDLRLRRPWGNVFVGASASNFMHDFSKNRISLNGRFSIRIYKGLSVTFGGNYELINDQLSLPKSELSLEDLLLGQRQVATTFEAGMNFGVNYTFGALYNNIVNTRL